MLLATPNGVYSKNNNFFAFCSHTMCFQIFYCLWYQVYSVISTPPPFTNSIQLAMLRNYNMFLNQACVRPGVGARLVFWNYFMKSMCVCVCLYICMYACIFVCLSAPTWPSKACFFPNQKPGVATIFEASFPSQLFRHPTTEKQHTRPHGMCILSFGKWAWPILTWTKMKSCPKALLEEF